MVEPGEQNTFGKVPGDGLPAAFPGVVGAVTAVRRWPSPSRWGLALVGLWTLELFLVQEHTLEPMAWMPWSRIIGYRLGRLLLDLAMCAALVCALPRRFLAVLFVLSLPFYLGLILHETYFHQPLSAQVMFSKAAEGAAVMDALPPLLRMWHTVLVASLVGKLALLWAAGESTLPWSVRWRPAVGLLTTYLALMAVWNPLLQPFYKLKTWESVSDIGSIYGYVPTWIAEWLLIDEKDVLERAIRRAQQGPPGGTERLVQVETHELRPTDRIVFLQVESLDAAVIDFRIDGREVTPRVNALRQRSLAYTVQAPKGTGSSDADFTALMARLPSPVVPTYKLSDYPYDGSIVEQLESRGYRTSIVHGVTGEFFNRRRAFERMGFDTIQFKEEFERELGAAKGWALADDVVLEQALKTLAAPDGPSFLLAITATTHLPFPLPERHKVFFPEASDERLTYFDAMHWLDAAIGRFVDQLPDGTTLVLYGDHSSQIENPDVGYRQTRHGDVGCTPLIVLQVGVSLSDAQQTGTAASSCELTMLEAFRFVHARLAP